MPGYFTDRRILITGASTGLGRELTLLLAREGAHLGLMARNVQRLQETAAEAQSLGGRPHVLPADVTDPAAVAQSVAQAVEHMGRVDMLINSAGLLLTGSAARADPGMLRTLMEVNYFGAMHCIRAVLPQMLGRGSGHIVNLSSMAGLVHFPGMAAYSATKFALRGYSDALRAELRPRGIHVTVAYPGVVDTGMLAAHLPSFRRSLAWRISKQPSQPVARRVLRAVRARRPAVFSSWLERLLVAVHALAPGPTTALLEAAAGGSPPPEPPPVPAPEPGPEPASQPAQEPAPSGEGAAGEGDGRS